MKAKLRKSITGDDGNFKPFDVDLTIETIEEAILLYHVFNTLSLKKDIFNGMYGEYFHKCAPFFECDLWEDIDKELTEQGFKI